MRCNICDASLVKPTFNTQINAWEPCQTCLDIIFSVFTDDPEGFNDPDDNVELAEADAVRSITIEEMTNG